MKRFKLCATAITLLSALCVVSCQKEAVHPEAVSKVETVTPKQALISVSIDIPLDFGAFDGEVGIAYGTASEYQKGNLTEVLAEESINASADGLKFVLKHLECDTHYNFHAFVRSNTEAYTGETMEFQTKPLPENTVDLHLSSDILWAKTNIGTTSTFGAGDLFSYGETAPKDTYTPENYKFIKDYNGAVPLNILKYVIPDGDADQPWYDANGVFTGDGKIILDPEDDVVTKTMGKGWRMPTPDDFRNLRDECEASYVYSDMGRGIRFQSEDGADVFLPTAALYDGIGYRDEDLSFGMYLSSGLWVGDDVVRIKDPSAENCSIFWFSPKYTSGSQVGFMHIYPSNRFWGFPVRGVYDCSVIAEPLAQWEGERVVEKQEVPAISDEANDLVKYGDSTRRLPVENPTFIWEADLPGLTYVSAWARSGIKDQYESFMISLYFDDISKVKEGEELTTRRVLAGFIASSNSSGTTSRLYGTVRLISKENDKITLRFENVRFKCNREKWVLNGTYTFDLKD